MLKFCNVSDIAQYGPKSEIFVDVIYSCLKIVFFRKMFDVGVIYMKIIFFIYIYRMSQKNFPSEFSRWTIKNPSFFNRHIRQRRCCLVRACLQMSALVPSTQSLFLDALASLRSILFSELVSECFFLDCR